MTDDDARAQWIASRAHYSAAVREGINAEALKGDDNTLHETVLSCIENMSLGYFLPSSRIIQYQLEAKLQDVWYVVIQSAKHLSPINDAQNTLVCYILGARARGNMMQPAAQQAGVLVDDDSKLSHNHSTTTTTDNTILEKREPIVLSDGRRFWSDLPLLGKALVLEWRTSYYLPGGYSEDNYQWVNLAAFIGRLIAVGFYDGTAACALSLFHETLEIERDLNHSPGEETVSIADLLNSLQQVIHHGIYGIMVLCYKKVGHPEGEDNKSNVGSKSSLTSFVDEGLEELNCPRGEVLLQSVPDPGPGFSIERLKFWRKRLQELAECGDESISENAECALTSISMSPLFYGLP